MGIYSRDNLASGLQNALDAALRRRDEYVKQDAARRDANVEAINNLIEGLAYAHEDELDDKKKKLLAEKAALQKQQQDALEDSMKRSGEALEGRIKARNILKTGMTPSGLSSNGPGIAYEQAMGMRGYERSPVPPVPSYDIGSGLGRYYGTESARRSVIPMDYLNEMLRHGEGVY